MSVQNARILAGRWVPRPYVSLVGPLLEVVRGRPRLWHHEDMPKLPLTVELEEDLIQAARAEATRKGQSEAAVVEQALREHLSLGPTVRDQVWAGNERDTLEEDEALKLVYDELKAMRRERRDSGKAAS
jgi:hypothetical protein